MREHYCILHNGVTSIPWLLFYLLIFQLCWVVMLLNVKLFWMNNEVQNKITIYKNGFEVDLPTHFPY